MRYNLQHGMARALFDTTWRRGSEMTPAYRPRVVDAELSERLAGRGGVVIEGPKACGKTATAMRLAASHVRLDVDAAARLAAETDPRLVLEGDVPRLIDEWQTVPALWNHVRHAIDDRRLPGQFILTGSAAPADDVTRHTGAGRLARLRMRPMSLFESGHSSGDVSLKELFTKGMARSAEITLSITDLAHRIAGGGWPAHVGLSDADAARSARDYFAEIERFDVPGLDEGVHDPIRVTRLLRALARHTATPAPVAALARDAGDGDTPLARQTVDRYLSILERLMIVEDQPAWGTHLRSRSIIRQSPKRHFVDPSLAAAALGASSTRMLQDLELMGFLFESLVVRDLRVYAQPFGGKVLHYRDNTGLEVDAVVEAPDGSWGAFEVKLGMTRVDEAAANLLRFTARVDDDRVGPRACLAVVVPSGYGYRRPDGVSVVPIGALGP